ncbi:histidine phosphatase family protein [Pseudomonadota bacterium]
MENPRALRHHPHMNIFLVRHGEAAARWHESDDPGLSELGRQQAAEAAQKLVGRIPPGSRLLSSPMQRARETAAPLAAALGAEPAIVEPFREIPTPVAMAERQTWLNRIARQTWSEQPALVQDWRRALLAALREIREPTVVFTHFMVLNVIVGALQANDRVVNFLPDNASVTTLHGFDDELQLAELGRQFRTKVN